MKKGIITAALSLGMLYAQAAGAGEMVRYDHALFIADAGSSSDTTKDSDAKAKSDPASKKSTKHARKGHKHHHHHHKHHRHHHHHRHYRDCDRCGDGMYMSRQGMVAGQPMYVDEVEPHMDIMNRDHGTRGGRGR